jgi:hypothetical protein
VGAEPDAWAGAEDEAGADVDAGTEVDTVAPLGTAIDALAATSAGPAADAASTGVAQPATNIPASATTTTPKTFFGTTRLPSMPTFDAARHPRFQVRPEPPLGQRD